MPEAVTGARARFEGIGTHWIIDVASPLAPAVEREVRAAVASFDQVWSRFRPDSMVTRLAAHPERLTVDDDGAAMLSLYEHLASATQGRVNPLVGRALEHLGYDASYTLRPREGEPHVPGWAELGWDAARRTVDPGRSVLLDVGAVGKGRLVDIVAGILEAAGIEQYTVDASGDLRHRGLRGDERWGEPLRVALEHPADPRRAVGIVRLPGDGRPHALCASGVNRRSWAGGLHHVLDGRSGLPVSDIVATWAVASTAMVADAAATLAFFVPADQVAEVLPEVTGVVRMAAHGPLEAVGIDGEVFA